MAHDARAIHRRVGSRWQVLLLAATVLLLAAACGSDEDDGAAEAAPQATPTTGAGDTGETDSAESNAGDEGSSEEGGDDSATTAATPAPAEDPEPTVAPTATPEPAPEPGPVRPLSADVRVPTVFDPPAEGDGIIQPLATAPMPDGYVETEFHFSGEATGYTALAELDDQGFWDSAESDNASFATRMIVRTPPADQFSGVVIMEWFNVTSGADTSPDWGYLHEMIGRDGHAYIGVSAQFVGVMGNEGGFIGGGLVDTRGMPTRDPARYGALDHPGDAFSFDIFSQAGAAAKGADGIDVLGGLIPTHVIAAGESQSAVFLTTYVNAVHPLVDVFDGFLIHSRGDQAPAPDGTRSEDALIALIRTDLNVPVLQYESETDLIGLGFVAARQPDSPTVRTWEVAGTAHADAYSLFASGLPRDASMGSILGCSVGINDGPHHETLAAAVHHLVAWVTDGIEPPESPLLEIEDGALVRDDLGVALGGIRTPVVDAPLRLLTGDAGPDGGACFLFGQTLDFEEGVLAELYPSFDQWAVAFDASSAAAVEVGWLLPEDAESMREDEQARAESLGLTAG